MAYASIYFCYVFFILKGRPGNPGQKGEPVSVLLNMLEYFNIHLGDVCV